MEYESFTLNKVDAEKCIPYVHVTLSLVGIAFVLLQCFCSTKRTIRRTERLEIENSTLRQIILKSVDNTLIKMMKNGYQSDTEDEE